MAEHKYEETIILATPETTGPNAPISQNGAFLDLSAPALGTSDVSRIGDKVTGTSIEINYCTYPMTPGTPGLPAAYVPALIWVLRVIIFVWKDDTTPTLPDITDIPSSFVSGMTFPIAPLDHDRKVKRKLLYDKTHTCYSDFRASFTGAVNPVVMRRFSIPLSQLRGGLNIVNYQGGLTVGVNNIWICFVSNIPATSTVLSGWKTEFYSRYNYIDM